MSSRIKGITVEIGGDTTKLEKALKGVNTEIKNTQSELKDVNKLLKIDPGNTELLSQKQKLLTQAVDETKKKLDTLKTAAEQANSALASGDITQEQYDALQREIAETEQNLKALEKAAKNSDTALQKMAANGEKLKSLGDKVSGVGQKLLPATATVTALGAASVKTAADFDSAMSKVAAVSGAAGDDLEKLRDKAREMGSKTKFSASEAAEAMNYMAMAGWKTEDMLDGIEGIMNLAAASGEDLSTTSDIVTDALTAFGLSAKDSGHFADILAAASSNANTNVSMMGETFKYCAPIAGSLGFSAEDTAEAIGLMANSGIKSSQAGTALRTVMTKLTGDIKLSGDALGEVTIATTNADGSMRGLSDILGDCREAFGKMTESEQANAVQSLVGKNAMSGFLALMNAAPADIEKLSTAIDDCNGKSEEMANTMQGNLAGQLTILKSQLQELAISVGELLMPAIRQIVSWVQKFVGKLNSMDETTKKVIVTIALIAAAVSPVLIIIGKVITAVGTIMTIIPKLAGVINVVKTAFSALNAVMLANPIFLVIAAITALVGIFIYLWNTSDSFRQFWIDLWENIKAAASAAWEAIKAFFTAAWEAIKSTAETIGNALKTGVLAIWNGIKTGITTAVNAIKNTVTAVWNAIKTYISTVLNFIKNTVSSVWNGIKNTVSTVVNAIKTAVTNVWNSLSNGIKNTMSKIFTTIKSGFDKAVSFITGLPSKALQWGKDIIMGIVDGIKSCISKIGDAAESVAGKIKSFLHFSVPDEGPLTDYQKWMPDFMAGLARGIEQSRGLIQKAIGKVSGDMLISPNVAASQLAVESAPSIDTSGIVSAVRDAAAGAASSGDIVIPIYLGGTMLDEIIVGAQQRANLRSGGR